MRVGPQDDRLTDDGGGGHDAAVEAVEGQFFVFGRRLDDGRLARFGEEVDSSVGDDRRGDEAAAKAMPPALASRLRIEAGRDAPIADDVKFMADECGRGFE